MNVLQKCLRLRNSHNFIKKNTILSQSRRTISGILDGKNSTSILLLLNIHSPWIITPLAVKLSFLFPFPLWVIAFSFFFCKAGDGLSDDQRNIQELAINFAAKELAPNMLDWDKEVSIFAYLHNFFASVYFSLFSHR